MRSALVIAVGLLAGACGHSPTPQERWFTARGRESPTWHRCLKLGAELRTTCGANAACASEVTHDMTRRCYAGRYAQETSQSKPTDEVRTERLSPCFWDREPNKPASPADYARRTCTSVVDASLQPECIAELREVIEVICEAGAIDLTGAGP